MKSFALGVLMASLAMADDTRQVSFTSKPIIGTVAEKVKDKVKNLVDGDENEPPALAKTVSFSTKK